MENPEDAFDICKKRQAILDGAGHMLVLGGPGSGKTTIALLKARRGVLADLAPEQSVLFLSFSNSAIRRILESAGNILVGDVAQRIEIKTYHSFAWEILRSHGYLTSSQRRLSIVPAQDAAVLRAGLESAEWEEEQSRLFTEEGRVTYDRFAPQAAEILERSDKVRRCFNQSHPLILVDEFQDTDENQWRLIRALSEESDVIALGDTEQRIYAWRPGVSEDRLTDFRDALKANTFDFENENNRSPATGIAGYARALLAPDVRQGPPDDIAIRSFPPGGFIVGVKLNVIRAWRAAQNRAGHNNLTIAVAGRSRTMVRMLSDALATTVTVKGKRHRPYPHDVMFDQNQIVLAARVIAYVLGSTREAKASRLASTLDHMADMFRAVGNKTNITASDRLKKWAEKCRNGKPPNTNCVNALCSIFKDINDQKLSGSPTQDWVFVRRAFESAAIPELAKTADHARYLRILRRGSLIEEELATLWKRDGHYAGAVEALERAILQYQLLDNHSESASISVMTMHQLKGREYDAVLLVEDQYRTFLGRDTKPPHMETRRLLQVSLTRARHYAIILSAAGHATLDTFFDDRPN